MAFVNDVCLRNTHYSLLMRVFSQKLTDRLWLYLTQIFMFRVGFIFDKRCVFVGCILNIILRDYWSIQLFRFITFLSCEWGFQFLKFKFYLHKNETQEVRWPNHIEWHISATSHSIARTCQERIISCYVLQRWSLFCLQW